jgi:hypothetical protein
VTLSLVTINAAMVRRRTPRSAAIPTDTNLGISRTATPSLTLGLSRSAQDVGRA